MTILIVGGACVFAVIAMAVTWALCPQGDHRASRPAHPGRGARAARRALGAVRGLPGATRWATSPAQRAARGAEVHHEPGLTAEDAATLDWVRQLRPPHPGWVATVLRARIAALNAITSTGRRGQPRNDGWQRAGLAGRAGGILPSVAAPAGETPGLESEGASRLTAPAPATMLPTRGDAQGRDVQPRATGSCQAAGAMTGSLSPRPHKEGARAASAPPPGPTPPDGETTGSWAGGTRLIQPTDRLEAELQATSPWVTRIPFTNWESDTFVGGLPAIRDGA